MTVPTALPVVNFFINDASGEEVEWSCGGSLIESVEYEATPPDGGSNQAHASARYQCQARAQGKTSISFQLAVNWNDTVVPAIQAAVFRSLLRAHGMKAVVEDEFGVTNSVIYPISSAVEAYLSGPGGNYNGEKYYGALCVVRPINAADALADLDEYIEPIYFEEAPGV